jgi:hypothetical protein
MSNTIPSADQGMLIMFSRLMADPATVDVASAMMALAEDLPATPLRTADMLVMVGRLTTLFPQHKDAILTAAMEA